MGQVALASRRSRTFTFAVALALPPVAAHAETSSWVHREAAPAASELPAAARDRTPRSATGKPQNRRAEAKPETGLGSDLSTHSKGFTPRPQSRPAPAKPGKAPPPGADDPYLAFDQGRYLTALSLAEARAKTGDAGAHTLIARIHAAGLGVPKNEALAANWFQRAAELGDVEAQFAYGVILAEGRGVPKNRSAAADMFE
ncbi:MAG: sel1 repeat family protein, partial [Hyphomicrobiaceae bacterium]|nr:sel1 repeat family protein [Hyphomicrobiaceae bacterium]